MLQRYKFWFRERVTGIPVEELPWQPGEDFMFWMSQLAFAPVLGIAIVLLCFAL